MMIEGLHFQAARCADDDAAREEQVAGFVARLGLGQREIAVGHEIPQTFTHAGPIEIERGHRQNVRQIDAQNKILGFAEQTEQESDLVGIDGLFAVGVHRAGHPTDQVGLQVGVFGTQDGMRFDDIALPVKRLEIVRHRHQVGFGGQFVSRVTPVGVGEGAKLAAGDKRGYFVLDSLEIIGAGFGPIRDGLRQCGGRSGIRIQSRDDIHPVERMQVVEMNDVILHILDGFNNIAHHARIGGNFNPEGIFDSSHGAECVYSRSNTADALGKGPGVSWVAAFENGLNTAPHGAAGPGLAHLSAVHLGFDAQVALNASYGINCNF